MTTKTNNSSFLNSDWFNSVYYPILYKNRDETEAKKFINNLLKVISLTKDAKILDLACGRGRHSIYLSTLGFFVTGIDSSVESISCAKNNESDNLKFHIHEMRNTFRESEYHLVLNLFTSFGYFENPSDDMKVLVSAHHSLKSGGRLVLDFMNVEKVIQLLKPEEELHSGEIHFLIKKKIEGQFLVKEITVNDGDKNFQYKEQVKLLRVPDFEKYFAETGFIVKGRYGDYNLNPFDTFTSDRLIWLVEKI